MQLVHINCILRFPNKGVNTSPIHTLMPERPLYINIEYIESCQVTPECKGVKELDKPKARSPNTPPANLVSLYIESDFST